MKKIFYSMILMATWTFCFTGNAYAYLDPGTGSIILQGIIGTVAAVSATVGLYWSQVKLYFKSTFSDPDYKSSPKQSESSEPKGHTE